MIKHVKMDDLYIAFMLWRKYHPSYFQSRARKTFARFCKGAVLPVFLGTSGGTWELTEEQEAMVRLLLELKNSPYAQTVIKAYEIRNNL